MLKDEALETLLLTMGLMDEATLTTIKKECGGVNE